MPLPLPNLDTRHWHDLVDEGRALIPRYAPGWTDHNAHDPGITIMEMLAWQVEQEMYRANRIPDAHRRKFLALAGYPVEPPRPASVALAFSVAGAGPVTLPAGLTVATPSGGRDGEPPAHIPFRLRHTLTVQPVAIAAVQSFDGARFADHTGAVPGGRDFPAWGESPGAAGDPASSPALYVGLSGDPGAGAELRLWIEFAGGRSGTGERARIIREAAEQAEACRPTGPQAPSACGPAGTPPAAPPPRPLHHHGMETLWEAWDGTAWQPLVVEDETRALTLDGPVLFTVPGAFQPVTVGEVSGPLFYLRCRLATGRPDAAPIVRALSVNTGIADQASDARATFEIAAGVLPPAGRDPLPGARQRLELAFDAEGRLSALASGAAAPWPEALILAYTAATAATRGSLECTLVAVGTGTGLPGQSAELAGPIANADCTITTVGAAGPEAWTPRPDLDAATPLDLAFALEPGRGFVAFGDGRRGHVPARGSTFLAAFARTAASGGNAARGAPWSLLGADDTMNTALLGGPVAATAALLGPIRNASAAHGGGQEEIAGAAGRAAEALWAHERLVELVSDGQPTLDQLDHMQVLSRAAPARATTLLDFERLALDVPGTVVGRARAWAALDARFPCLKAPGTVTVVIVPGLPAGRPVPTEGLLDSVRRYLGRRRVIGTRLLVVGPDYVVVRVRATVQTLPRASATRVAQDIREALDTFLDPIRGGPDGRGWPFGRDIYRSEMLQLIDGVPGVDHITALELFAGGGEADCGNICVGPASLTTPGVHEVTVR
ncbi:MAG: baseplate J/gp47 family protein [Dehalococcoidia bacterium]